MELDRGERLLRASGTSYSLVVMAACAAVVSVGLLVDRGFDHSLALAAWAGLAAVGLAFAAVFITTEVLVTAERVIEYRPLLARLARRVPSWGPLERSWRRSVELDEVTAAYASGGQLVLRDRQGRLWRLMCHDAPAASALAHEVAELQKQRLDAHKRDMRARREARRRAEGLGVHVSSVASGPARCTYCHDDFAEGEERTGCDRCGAPHHGECFEIHGGCAVLACAGRARRRRA